MRTGSADALAGVRHQLGSENRAATLDRLTRLSGGGVHTPVIRKDVLAGIEMPVPAIPVQRAIVEFDALIRRERELQDELTARRKVLYDVLSLRAARAEIEENDFNLNIPRYVDTFEPEPEIDVAAVQKEIEAIEGQLAATRAKMSGYLQELGF